MSEDVLLTTPEGYKEMQDRYTYLTTVRRKEIAERLKIARGFGDLSENAEYDAAKNEQAENEDAIVKLESDLRRAEVVDKVSKGTINIGNTVKVKENKKKKEREYKIVGTNQADPLNGRISDKSAIGKALLGAKVGEKVEVELPNGNKKTFEILSIEVTKND